MVHSENHLQDRVNWLRASVLGANDGIISTASLIMGVASASSSHEMILFTGIAGLVAGAISMAAGEYVSVCSQSDLEENDLAIERRSLKENYEGEVMELAKIYQNRGVDETLSEEVARQLMHHDALGAHARDDIGISEISTANPVLAALSSATSFSIGALLPLIAVMTLPPNSLTLFTPLITLICLSFLGGLSSYLSGTKPIRGILRVTFWGSVAMLSTFLIGTVVDIGPA